MEAAITLKICADCGHLDINHSKMMGCMVQGSCNYKQTHYCDCEQFKEIIHEASSKNNEVT